MLLPASQEYIALCQSQVSLLIHGVRATEIAVYLTENFESTGSASLKPLVVYPEVQEHWPASIQWQLPGAATTSPRSEQGPLLLESASEKSVPFDDPFERLDTNEMSGFGEASVTARDPLMESTRQQMVLPLMHDNAVLGVLMVARLDDEWKGRERTQIEQVANTLAMACVLDQRSQWLAQSSYDKQMLLGEEHQRLAKLLHQFRNPLTALRTLGKLMLRRMTEQDANRQFAQSIVQQSDRLETMLKEFSQTLDVGEAAIDQFDQTWSMEPSSGEALPLLPAAGILSGATLSLQPCWLEEVLRPIVQAVQGRLEERSMTLNLHVEPDLPPIRGDVQALNEILSNLIDNAIKYSPDGGVMTVTLSQETDPLNRGAWQVISVSDTGLGIPESDLDRIFVGKYRGIQAESDIPGTGLGLAIAKDLIQKMRGQVEAFSPALVKIKGISSQYPGSTFRVSLPALSLRDRGA